MTFVLVRLKPIPQQELSNETKKVRCRRSGTPSGSSAEAPFHLLSETVRCGRRCFFHGGCLFHGRSLFHGRWLRSGMLRRPSLCQGTLCRNAPLRIRSDHVLTEPPSLFGHVGATQTQVPQEASPLCEVKDSLQKQLLVQLASGADEGMPPPEHQHVHAHACCPNIDRACIPPAHRRHGVLLRSNECWRAASLRDELPLRALHREPQVGKF